MQTSYTIIYAVSFLHFLYWYSKVTSHMGVFLYSAAPKMDPTWKSKRKIERRQIKLDLVIAHQSQCSHQVSLNLANLDFQGVTRFLSQGRPLQRFPLFWLAVIFQRDFSQMLIRKLNGVDQGSFCEDEFSFVLVEAPANFNYNSLEAECCSGEDWGLSHPLSGFLENDKCVGTFQNCLQNENGSYFHVRLMGSPRSCSWYYF